MEKYSKNRHLTQRLLFYLTLSLIFILTSVIYESRVLHNRYPENVFEDFQQDFSSAEKFLASSLRKLADEKYMNDDVLMELECLASAQKLLERRNGNSNGCFTQFTIDVYHILGQRLSSLIAARHSSSEEERTSILLTQLSKDSLDVCCKIVAIQCLALHKVPNHPLLGLQLFTLGDLYEENGYGNKAMTIYKWAYDVLRVCQGPSNFMVLMLEDKLK